MKRVEIPEKTSIKFEFKSQSETEELGKMLPSLRFSSYTIGTTPVNRLKIPQFKIHFNQSCFEIFMCSKKNCVEVGIYCHNNVKFKKKR